MDQHDGEIRSSYYELTEPAELDGARFGRVRLGQIADRAAVELEIACGQHELLLSSRDELPRVSNWSGRPMIKVRGCRYYRGLAEPMITAVALKMWGVKPRRLV